MSKQQIFIFCGPDMTGKTEISKELSKVLGIPYFKATSEHSTYLKKKDMFLQQLRYADPRIADILGQTGHSIIFDRGFPCEFVYANVFGRETDMRVLKDIDAMYASMNTWIIITCRKSYDGIVDDLDHGIDSSVLEKLHNGYREFGKWTKCKVLYLPVDDEDLNREIKDIMIGTGLLGDE